jgi:hypothetical protein
LVPSYAILCVGEESRDETPGCPYRRHGGRGGDADRLRRPDRGPTPQLVPPPTSPGAVSADFTCRQYADAQIAPLRDQANAQGAGSALLGAGLGAALGGAIGGGRGAGIGAASGATANLCAGISSLMGFRGVG